MNRQQVKGRVNEVVGKAVKNTGRATGSVKMEAQGLAKEAGGKVQKTVGDVAARNDKRR